MLRSAIRGPVSRALQRRVICVRSTGCVQGLLSPRVNSCRRLSATSSSQHPKAEQQPSVVEPTPKVVQVLSRSVPFSQRSLIRLLLTEKVIEQKDHAAFEQLCSALEFAVRKHHQRLADEIYPLFGQLRTDAVSNRSATIDDEFWFLNRLAQLSTKAGFVEADESELRNLVENARRVNSLIVSSNSTRYDVLRCFVLDVADREQVAQVKAEKVKAVPKKTGILSKLFSRAGRRAKSHATSDQAKAGSVVHTTNSNVTLSSSKKYKRVLLTYREKSTTFSELRVLMLKDVSLDELDRALPDSTRQVRIAPLYSRVVRAAGLLCSGAVLSQLAALYAAQSATATAYFVSPAALTSAAIWCTGVALASGALVLGTLSLTGKQRMAYERAALEIAQRHVVATSKSLIQLLFERASAETLKEATIAYAFLLRSGATLSESEFYEVRQLELGAVQPKNDKSSQNGAAVFHRDGMSQFLLETMIRKWFADAFNLSVAYSADDAVTFLASAGLLVDADDPAEARSGASSLTTEPSGLVSAAVRVGTRGKNLRVLSPIDCAMRALPYNVHYYALGIDPLSQTRLIRTDAKLTD